MASSKVMPSSTSRNSDLRRRSSSSASTKSLPTSELPNLDHLTNLQQYTKSNNKDSIGSSSKYLGSMTVDGTLLDAEITLLDAAGAVTAISDNEAAAAGAMMPTIRRLESGGGSNALPKKTVDDVWKEIVAGRSERRECKKEAPDEMMTLEDFLAKTGAVEVEDVKVEPAALPEKRLSGGIFSFDSMPLSPLSSQQSFDSVVGFGNGVEVVGGRGKRLAVLEPLDKAAQQRQRRMIKNRESAARSRERKQAYQVELESLAVKLEEENEKLMKEKAERSRKRYQQLMVKVIPVVEKRRPRRTLRKVHSMHW
ncbi:hypothetical protein NMG60_11017253 [Bertholletia excelsa]